MGFLDYQGLQYLYGKILTRFNDNAKTISEIQTILSGKSESDHTHFYAGSASVGGSANSAVKLDTSAGSVTQPIYFKDGKPVKTTYALNKTVPSDAKFTDTTYNNATTSVAGLMSATDKAKLDGIATGANKYVLPTASSTLGGVKTTSTVTSASGYTACPIISGVPYYKDTNTKYTLSSFSITATATELNILDGVTATTAEINYLSGVTSAIQTQLDGKSDSGHTHKYAGSSSAGGSATSAVKLDSSAGSATQPIYFKDGKPVKTTYTLSKSVPSDAKFTDTTYSVFVKSGSGAASGLVPAPSTTAGTTKYLREDGTWTAPPNTTYNNMTAATASAAGKAGLVPAPAAGAQAKYLRGDGKWATPTNTTYSDATTSAAGLMSSADKTKLDGIATGANKYVLPTASSSTLGGVKTTSAVTSTSGYTACPIISGVPYYKDTNTTYTLSSFGITATATELNYCDGVTSNIQTQLNGKFSTAGGNLAGDLILEPDGEGEEYGRLYVRMYGTTTKNGETYLQLGNNIPSGTAHNSYGYIMMYGVGSGCTQIKTTIEGSLSNIVYLPSSTGTLALTSECLLKSGGKMDGSITLSNTATTSSSNYVRSTVFLPESEDPGAGVASDFVNGTIIAVYE